MNAADLPLLSARFADALRYAFELHQHQTRKISGTPYVGHLLSVAGLVIEHGGDEDTAIAALLHDSIEDQGGAALGEEILTRFGPRVLAIVNACTDSDVAPKPPWQERKQRHLEHALTAPAEVRLVLAADKLHNLRALLRDYGRQREAIWSAFRGGRGGTLWYYRQMLANLRQSGDLPLLDEYAQALQQLEHLVAKATHSSSS